MTALTAAQLGEFRAAFDDDPAARIAQNAVISTTVADVALDRGRVARSGDTFSTRLDRWTVTDQKRSGRCWCFAALNLLRVGAMRRLNVEHFEFSQTWTLFWDKMERSNWFLEAILRSADRPLDDRAVAFLLARPLDDGGQWNMAMNLIARHGLVPRSVMPETESSGNTRRMNASLKHKLRAAAKDLRGHTLDSAESLQSRKHRHLEQIWRILCIHLGTPPERFDWQWEDRAHVFHRVGMLTPLEFVDQVVDIPYTRYVCLVHDPRSPYGRTYSVKYLGNVVGGAPVIYLNVEIQILKDVTRRLLERGEPVWMGCDVGKQMARDPGLWDARLFDYASLYGVEFGLTKVERLTYHQSAMTHAMLFTGVDVVDGRPRRWRVENSWGEKSGTKGYYTMNDSWFDEYMFEIAAPPDLLPDHLQAALDQEPIYLPPWDPMGALARSSC